MTVFGVFENSFFLPDLYFNVKKLKPKQKRSWVNVIK